MKTKDSEKNRKLRIHSLVLTILGVIMSMNIFAQSSGEIQGRVIDASTGETIPMANIVIKIGDVIAFGTSSDLQGYFKLKPVSVGTHIVTISCVGYGTQELLDVLVDADKITNLRDIKLMYGETLKPFTVFWKKDLVDADDPSKKTMDMIVVKKIPGSSNFTNLLSTISSDIYTSEDQKEIHFRGSRANDAVYVVDGIVMINPGAMIPTRGIGNMTVYSGGVPARYGDFTGGVIIVESEGYFSWLNKQKSKQLMSNQ